MLQNTAGYESDGSFCKGEHSLLFKYASTGGSNRVFDKIVRMHSGNADNAASCTITDTGFVLNWTKYGDIPEDTILMKIDIM